MHFLKQWIKDRPDYEIGIGQLQSRLSQDIDALPPGEHGLD